MAKKSFKDSINPAMSFISQEGSLQLLVQPSLKAKLKEKAKQEGTSVNDLVHSILEEALTEE